MATSSRPLNPLVAPFSPASERKIELETDFLNLSKGDKQSCTKLAELNLFLLDKISNLENQLTQRLLTDFRVRITNLEREVKYRTSFAKLYDGCHPSQDLCYIWSLKLSNNAKINLEYYPTFYLINHMYC